jgi:pimeloyl-ACP methyl ester carboxylesterase
MASRTTTDKVVKGLAIGAALIAVPALFNKTNQMRGKKMPDAFQAAERVYRSRYGDVHYIRKGSGDSLILLHGLEAGSSSYEWRNNFDSLAEHMRVFNLDLLGYGLSEKPPLQYSIDLYSSLLLDFIDDVVNDYANIVASPSSIPIVLEAINRKPALFQKVCLISPLHETRTKQGDKEIGSRVMETAAKLPLVGNTMYQIITQKPNLNKKLKERYHQDIVNEEMNERYFHTSLIGGPNAYRAPMAYVSGELKSDYESLLHTLGHPVLIVSGQHAQTANTTWGNFAFAHKDSRIVSFRNCGLHPHEECPHDFNRWIAKEMTGVPDMQERTISTADSLR